MDSQHYVYLHKRLTDGSIFYVGKGRGRRAWSSSGRNRWWKNVSAKRGFSVEIAKDGMPEPCALAYERCVIASIGRENLTNLVDGGGGITGWKHSEEAKAKIGRHFKGREITPKMRKALSDYNRNKVLSEEHKAKLSAAKKGKTTGPKSAETRAKISAAHIGMKHSEETRRKMSASSPRLKGVDSNSHDKTVREFVHPEHGTVVCTQLELREKFGLASTCLSSVIHGRQKSVKGWKIK